MNQHIDTACHEPQTRPEGEPADLSYWVQLCENYQPEWFPLGVAGMPEG
jgi:hypothetical protein